ncbi:hypothetical protein PVAND_017133 [Polypedilum vanderplanki]|uniref:Uncharacterized protein n=1 Tax=Polypedilum vanderplanki TaxID=319348 RepID=A0A9J6BH80_POLVA|nr:hypothetical protein PVAND_017133 [Polypedilum vanderplanki]
MELKTFLILIVFISLYGLAKTHPQINEGITNFNKIFQGDHVVEINDRTNGNIQINEFSYMTTTTEKIREAKTEKTESIFVKICNFLLFNACK